MLYLFFFTKTKNYKNNPKEKIKKINRNLELIFQNKTKQK